LFSASVPEKVKRGEKIRKIPSMLFGSIQDSSHEVRRKQKMGEKETGRRTNDGFL